MKKIIILFLLINSLIYPKNPYNEVFFSIAVKEYILGITFLSSSKIENSLKTFKELKKDIPENDLTGIIDLEKLGITYSHYAGKNFTHWNTLSEWIESCKECLGSIKEYENFSLGVDKYKYDELCFGNFNDDYTAYQCLKILEGKMGKNLMFSKEVKTKKREILKKEIEETLSANRKQQKILIQHILLEHSADLSIPELVAMCNNYNYFKSGLI